MDYTVQTLKFVVRKFGQQDDGQKIKWLPKCKVDHNSLNFQARSSRLCLVVYIELPHKKQNKTSWPQKMAIQAQN